MAVVLQPVDFERARVRVHEPEMSDALARVDRHLEGAVGAGRGRRQDLADTVGGKLEPGGVG